MRGIAIFIIVLALSAFAFYYLFMQNKDDGKTLDEKVQDIVNGVLSDNFVSRKEFEEAIGKLKTERDQFQQAIVDSRMDEEELEVSVEPPSKSISAWFDKLKNKFIYKREEIPNIIKGYNNKIKDLEDLYNQATSIQ